jgi:pyridoxal phosphate enzyme (YggS family)
MSDIQANIQYIHSQIPESVKLVAVSKTKPHESILEAYTAGQRIFGENRVQEILSKKDILPADIEWHMIGHLQSNKVKSIVPFVSMIQSVDTARLLTVINSESQKSGIITNCLIQIHIAEEETKTGFSPAEVDSFLGSDDYRNLKNVRICGLMGMATFTDNTTQVRKEFRFLADLFRSLKNRFFSDDPAFSEISMGMSGDYKLAIEEGSTMVRIGSLIFGERNKAK